MSLENVPERQLRKKAREASRALVRQDQRKLRHVPRNPREAYIPTLA